MPGRRVEESPIAPLVAFSAATNLGIAGRTFRIEGEVPEALRQVLRGFGAREADEAGLVLATDVDAAAAAATAGDDRPVVVVGVGAQAPEPDGDVLRRHGVETAGRRVSVVRALPDGARGGAVARIEWAREGMPVTGAAVSALGALVQDVRIGISMVLEPKTAVLALLLAEAGAEVSVFAFAAETDDAVAAELRTRGLAVHASATATHEEERRHALALLDDRPQLLVDDGAHVIRLVHRERPEVVAGLLGASEETTSGVMPLRAMAAAGALRIPVVAANDAVTKTWFDNRHGTGETCVLAIVRALDDDLSASAAVVIGFGPVGEGVAERLRALGARVTVVDTDARRELAARFAGFATAPIEVAVRDAELVVSATGVPRTVDAAVLAACREDAVVAVAGGAPEEVLAPAGTRVEPLAPHLERLHLPGGGSVRLLAGGDCVNIVAGEGNPIDVMDLSFAVQVAALRRLLEGPRLPPGMHALADAQDRGVAAAVIDRGIAPEADRAPTSWERTRFDL